MNPRAARLLAFLVAATRARHVAAVHPEAEALEALRAAATRDGSRLTVVGPNEAADPSDADGAGLVYLGASAPARGPAPHGVLVVRPARRAPSPDADPAGEVRVWAALGPAADAPGLELSMAGASPTAEAEAALAAIAAGSARERPTEPVAAEVGRLLLLLARARRTRRALEIGTSAGAATLWLASALAPIGGRLTTVERDSARRTQAVRNVRRAGLEAVVSTRVGEAARVVPRLEEGFELVFLDEAPEDRLDDLAVVMERTARGALVVAHGDPEASGFLAGVAATLRTHPGVRATTSVAVGHGLELAVLT